MWFGTGERLVAGDTDSLADVYERAEQLVAADTDKADDIYERAGGVTTLISTGPLGGNGPLGAYFAATTASTEEPATTG